MILSIQGLRGIAILSVFSFHLWPQCFPNGYIGVDMFFVISGYLMSLIFSKYKQLKISDVSDFYCKRIKRIFPLYFLFTLLTFIISQFLLKSAWISLNNRYFLYSLFFLKNMETIWDGSNYFTAFQASAPSKDIYLHAWSLSIEVQFYLIVPIIFAIVHRFQERNTKLLLLCILGMSSYVKFSLGTESESFNSMTSRIWQFVVGMLAYFWSEVENNEKGKSFSYYSTTTACNDSADSKLLYVFLTILLPLKLPSGFFRPLITVSTGLLMYSKITPSTKILEHPLLTYVGDASYAIYLFHYPVITFLKGSDIHAQHQLAIGLTFLFGLLIHEFLEKRYRNFSMKKIWILTVVLLSLNVVSYGTVQTCPAVQKWLNAFRMKEVDSLKRLAIEKNFEMAAIQVENIAKCIYNESASEGFSKIERPWGVCDYLSGSGKRKVLIVGNSYAINQANVVYDEFEGNFSQFRLISNLWLQVLYDEWANSSGKYKGQHEELMEMIEEFQPDVLFILTRFQDKQKHSFDMQNDNLLKEYNKNIKRIESATTTKVLIEGAFPLYEWLHINNFIEALSKNKTLDAFHLSKQVSDEEMKHGRDRMNAMKCNKCEIIELGPSFQDGNKYLGFDPETMESFIDNDVHLTKTGQERIRPAIRKLINQL